MNTSINKRFYGEDLWKLFETEIKPGDASLNATLFALANGFVGLRGDVEETDTLGHGCYLNGVYSSEPILYGESAYGFAKNNQKIASAPSPLNFSLRLDGETVNCYMAGRCAQHQRSLDLSNGILQRESVFQAQDGRQVKISSRRLVSLSNQNLVVIEYAVESLDFDGELSLTSGLHSVSAAAEATDDPRVGTDIDMEDMEVVFQSSSNGELVYIQHINSTAFYITSLAQHVYEWDGDLQQVAVNKHGAVGCEYQVHLSPGKKFKLTKYVHYEAARGGARRKMSELGLILNEISRMPFSYYAQQQEEELFNFWRMADVNIESNSSLQQGMRFNLFHLFQSVGRSGTNNIAAKGITGNGYDGHYFWDTEIYIFPFFLFTKPDLAKNLLMYRYSILNSARQRAREMSISKGALFPWRTIGGEECSAYYPAGTAQYHINADIAYAIKQYHSVVKDNDFLKHFGAEMVIEGARVWMSIGHFNPAQGNKFCITCVTGPDEYTAVVNNNFYTNIMAKMHLQFAVDVFDWLEALDPSFALEFSQKLSLERRELTAMAAAAKNMFLPYDETLGIHLQDDSFLGKPNWDFANTPKEKYPLLLHFHPLVIYRHKVCKQADTILALLLLSEEFTLDEKRRDFDFYEPLTTHDSTLSACIHSILASEVGYSEKAFDYFNEVVRMDLDNSHANTQHGIHTACMGGAWLCMVQGFAGMRVQNGGLAFSPRYYNKIGNYAFTLKFGGCDLHVRVTSSQVEYQLLNGDALVIRHSGQKILVTTEKVRLSLQDEVSLLKEVL